MLVVFYVVSLYAIMPPCYLGQQKENSLLFLYFLYYLEHQQVFMFIKNYKNLLHVLMVLKIKMNEMWIVVEYVK